MLFPAYIERVALQAGLTLMFALPFIGVAASQSRFRRWGLLLFVLCITVFDTALLEIPRIGVFQRLHWSWQESILSTAWPFLLVALASGRAWFQAGYVSAQIACGFPSSATISVTS